jgi:hypothetical protein
MAYKVILNPFTGQLQLATSITGSSGVTGIAPTTVNAIATWENTTATTIQNSLASVQASGDVHSQGFITQSNVTGVVTLALGEVWIAPGLALQPGSGIVLSSGSALILL